MDFFGKKIIFSFLIAFILFFQPIIISAEENLTLKNEIINPGSFYYPFKRLWEKGMVMLQFNIQSKVDFYQSQLKIRLSELNYVVGNKLLGEVQQSSERFAYTAGVLTNELVEQNKSEDKKKVIKDFEKYKKYLEGLRDKYPANTSFWMLVQHDINTLGILSEKIK